MVIPLTPKTMFTPNQNRVLKLEEQKSDLGSELRTFRCSRSLQTSFLTSFNNCRHYCRHVYKSRPPWNFMASFKQRCLVYDYRHNHRRAVAALPMRHTRRLILTIDGGLQIKETAQDSCTEQHMRSEDIVVSQAKGRDGEAADTCADMCYSSFRLADIAQVCKK